MIEHVVRPQAPGERLRREDQLAWKLAAVATSDAGTDDDVVDMVANRILDNAAVAAAALAHHPVRSAREQALGFPRTPGARLYGLAATTTVSPEWAAWANAVAVRQLDFHDTFLAAEYSHPGDNIAPLVAVAQHTGADGRALARGIAVAYEIQVCLARAISLHAHAIDHVAHLGPSVACGIGALLALPTEVVFQAVNQSLHLTTATRQSRKGEISTWKAYAPAFAAKVAVEAIDRALREETSPAPIYEGEDAVIARLLDGPTAEYHVRLPAPGEPCRSILDTYTKAYAAEYQAQAIIDLARRMRPAIGELSAVRRITVRTSHHTHQVIGTGAGDPEKLDPAASRETLDHSLMYLLAVALEDGEIHHERSYTSERASRPSTVALWHKVVTVEEPEWTRRYHDEDPARRAFGGRVVVERDDGSVVEDELAVADAHPLGAHPFARPDYVAKLATLAEGVIAPAEQERLVAAADRLIDLAVGELGELGFEASLAGSVPGTAKGLW